MIPNSKFNVLNTLGLRIQKVELWARGHKSENGAERPRERTRAHIRAAGGRGPTGRARRASPGGRATASGADMGTRTGPGAFCAIFATAHGPTIQLDNNLLYWLLSSALRLGWSHFWNGQAFVKSD